MSNIIRVERDGEKFPHSAIKNIILIYFVEKYKKNYD